MVIAFHVEISFYLLWLLLLGRILEQTYYSCNGLLSAYDVGIYADALFFSDIWGSLKGGLKHYFVVYLFKQYAVRALRF